MRIYALISPRSAGGMSLEREIEERLAAIGLRHPRYPALLASAARALQRLGAETPLIPQLWEERAEAAVLLAVAEPQLLERALEAARRALRGMRIYAEGNRIYVAL